MSSGNDRDRLDELAEEFASGGYAPEGADLPPDADQHGGHGSHGGHDHGGGSLREFEYHGHTVRITTHYEVTIDGEPWAQPMEVQPDGSVVCHALPAYATPSAADMVRAVIDQSYDAPAEIREMIEATRREEA